MRVREIVYIHESMDIKADITVGPPTDSLSRRWKEDTKRKAENEWKRRMKDGKGRFFSFLQTTLLMATSVTLAVTKKDLMRPNAKCSKKERGKKGRHFNPSIRTLGARTQAMP